MPDVDDGMDITGDSDEDYVGGGFDEAAYDVFAEDEETPPDSGKTPPDDSTGAETPPETPAGDTAAAPETPQGQGTETPPETPEPPEDPAFDELQALRRQNEQMATNLQLMQAQMQQIMQGQAPPAQGQQTAQQAMETASNDYGINMDEIDQPSEDEWAENPNKAMAKVMTQVNAKVADKIKSGVTQEVSQGVMQQLQQQQQIQQAQQQGIRNALELVPEAASRPEVQETYNQIMANPANAALRQIPNGSFFAVLAAANVHGLSPVTARQQAQQQGRQQGAQAERSRQQRLKAGVMQTGGKGGQATVTLSPRERTVAKQMGLSAKQYADALQAQQGGSNNG